MSGIRLTVLSCALSLLPSIGLVAQDGDRAWSVLQSELSEQHHGRRAAAVRAMGLLVDNPKAADLATKALADENSDVRAAAAEALGQMRAKAAVADLKRVAQSDEEPAVVMASARSLIALGDRLGYNVYYAILTGERKTGASLTERQKKTLRDPKKMAQFGFETGVGFIPFAGIGVGVVKTIRKDDTSPVRAAAARILARDSDAKSAQALLDAASDHSWIVRAAALDAIARRNDPSLAAQIQGHLEDDKEEVRCTAAAAVLHLQDLKAATANRTKRK